MTDSSDDDLPITPVQAWTDSKGQLHPTKEAALFVEIERLLGHVGTGESLAPGIARLLVERRNRLMPLLKAFDGAGAVNASGGGAIIEPFPLTRQDDKDASRHSA